MLSAVWWLLGGAILLFIGILLLPAPPVGPVLAFVGVLAVLIGCGLFARARHAAGNEGKKA